MKNLKPYLPHIVAFAIIVIGTVLIEYAMGRILFCKCGYVSFWYGDTNGPGNSQHITDWYSFSHLIHGFLFYGFLHLVSKWIGKRKMRRGEAVLPGGHALSMSTRLVWAVGIEAGWELLENSSFIIDRYRAVTLANDYIGDSILNSVVDIFTAGLGFLMARRLPVTLSIVLIITLEVFAAYFVRDNLTLNVIMLLFPLEAVKNWQMGL